MTYGSGSLVPRNLMRILRFWKAAWRRACGDGDEAAEADVLDAGEPGGDEGSSMGSCLLLRGRME